MALDADDVAMLDKHARQIGDVVGWDLRFAQAPDSELVGLAADGVFIYGPKRVDEMTSRDVGMDLDQIAVGSRLVVAEEDGT